jgi:hypothetical protein
MHATWNIGRNWVTGSSTDRGVEQVRRSTESALPARLRAAGMESSGKYRGARDTTMSDGIPSAEPRAKRPRSG